MIKIPGNIKGKPQYCHENDFQPLVPNIHSE
jgi:hypothetical protein